MNPVLIIATPVGEFAALFSRAGLRRISFPGSPRPRESNGASPFTAGANWPRLAEQAILDVLSGRKPAALPPLDLSEGTRFQRRVWSALRKIPLGQVKTYGELAREIGAAKAARAVGTACGANPIPLLIPCHRVVAAHGGLGGFSGGLKWKKMLLAKEGLSEPFLGAAP